MFESDRMKRQTAYGLIIFTALISHGLLLFNDGIYLDGWLTYSKLVERNWDSLFSWLMQAGLPIEFYFHRFMDYFPGFIFKFKLVAFLSILLSAILVYKICDESRLASQWESLCIALISLVYPAFQIPMEITSTSDLVSYCFFLLAVLLAVWSEQASGAVHYSLRACSAVLFFLGFNLNSLLVFYFGFLLFLLILERQRKAGTWREVLARFLPRRLGFLLLPFMYWIAKEVFFPRHGDYSDLNRFQFSPTALLGKSGLFIVNAIYGQLNNALEMMLTQPALTLFILLAIYWISVAFKMGSTFISDNQRNPYGLITYGGVLLALGAFPYIAVGVAPTLHGFNTRHAILIGLPMAIILTGTVRLIFSQGDTGLSKTARAVLATLIVAFSMATIDNYFAWQARWVKDRSIMENLAHMSDFKRISVFWVEDEFQLRGAPDYAVYDWGSMFKQVWGGESRIGLNTQFFTSKDLADRESFSQTWALPIYNLSELDPAGCQAVLNIRRGRLASPDDSKLAVRYLFLRFLAPEQMTQFLEGVTTIHVGPLLAPEAVHCRT